MRAGAVIPREKGSARLVDMPVPSPASGEVLIRILRVTLDGTDAELNQGVYGEAPTGEKYLVMGHEALGHVESSRNSEFTSGELVTLLVRRPDSCANCQNGRSDMCLDGNYRECGIKGAHGYLRKWVTVAPDFLVKVPAELKDVGTLAEPLSISVKGLEQALEFHRSRSNTARTVLILGAGSLGLLATALARSGDFDVRVGDVLPESSLKARMVKELGAEYFNTRDISLSAAAKELGDLDVIMETTGNGELIFEACRVLGINGVLCLMGIAAADQALTVDANRTGTQLVMGNRLVFGTVSSNRSHFEGALKTLEKVQDRWPGWLDRLITERRQLEEFERAFRPGPDSIKTAIEIS